jgi:hypothetical protein
MSAPENPPAFPNGAFVPGMTLRDWFAGQALAGLLAGQYAATSHYNLSEVPDEAYRIADAMLLARKGGEA